MTLPVAMLDAEANPAPVWRLSATPTGGSSQLVDLRMVSPTTYVKAPRAVADTNSIEAFDATIFVGNWSMTAARLTIDLRIDAVEITSLRNDAPKE